ncbi:hypothetical protein UlMin_034854 [Ulmus minor]
MEPCPHPPLIAKKLTNMARLFFFMLQKSVSKKKLIPDFTLLMQRGKILGKSFNDLMLRHNTALGCSSHDVQMSFVSPRDYEFSCSSSPPPKRKSYNVPSCHVSRRKGHYYKSQNHHHHRAANVSRGRVAAFEVDEVQTTTSTLSFRDVNEGYCQVDIAAEEFIERFYRELMLQKLMTREGTDRYV